MGARRALVARGIVGLSSGTDIINATLKALQFCLDAAMNYFTLACRSTPYAFRCFTRTRSSGLSYCVESCLKPRIGGLAPL